MNLSNRWLSGPRSRPAAARALRALDRGAWVVPAALTILCVLTLALRGIDHVQFGALVNRYQAALSAPGTPGAPGSTAAPSDPKQQAELQERTREINQRNLFANPPPTPQLTGIFGDEAFFGGQGFKAGQTFMNIKVVKINGDSIDAEVDGKPTKLYVFGPGGGPAPGGGPMMGMPRMLGGRMFLMMPGASGPIPTPSPAFAPGPAASPQAPPRPMPAPTTESSAAAPGSDSGNVIVDDSDD